MPWKKLQIKLMIIRSQTKFRKKSTKTTFPSHSLSSISVPDRKYSFEFHWNSKMKNSSIVTSIVGQIIRRQFAPIFATDRYLRLFLSQVPRILAVLFYLLLRNIDSTW